MSRFATNKMNVEFPKTSRNVALSRRVKYLIVALGLAFVFELFPKLG